MIKQVDLLWTEYNSKKIYVIGTLSKIENGYIFSYSNLALEAKKHGCFLPFAYSTGDYIFDKLPPFFLERMCPIKYIDQLGLNYNMKDELSILLATKGVVNGDNYSIKLSGDTQLYDRKR